MSHLSLFQEWLITKESSKFLTYNEHGFEGDARHIIYVPENEHSGLIWMEDSCWNYDIVLQIVMLDNNIYIPGCRFNYYPHCYGEREHIVKILNGKMSHFWSKEFSDCRNMIIKYITLFFGQDIQFIFGRKRLLEQIKPYQEEIKKLELPNDIKLHIKKILIPYTIPKSNPSIIEIESLKYIFDTYVGIDCKTTNWGRYYNWNKAEIIDMKESKPYRRNKIS